MTGVQFSAPDREAARTLLRYLDPDSEEFLFQTFDDSQSRGNRGLARIVHGTLDERWSTLVNLSGQGAGIFICINKTDSTGKRTIESVILVRAYFADFDDVRPEAIKERLVRFGLTPHMIVESSPGKWHVYWFVFSAPLGEFSVTQARLAVVLGSDRGVKDLPRVMRLPGFPHQKDGCEPSIVRIVATYDGPNYVNADFQAALAAAESNATSLANKGRSLAAELAAGLRSPLDMTQGYPDGQRTDQLTKRAGWCLGPKRMSESDAVEACLAWNLHNTPPLAEEKVRDTVASIAKSEARKRETNSHPINTEPSDDAEITRLANLQPLAYERERKGAAERLNIRASILDRLVADEREKLFGDNGRQGQAVSLPEAEPWSDPVDGAELLAALSANIRRHVVMADNAADTAALWAVHTYLLGCFGISPRLAITSPEKGCGKTTLLDVLSGIIARPLPTANASAAAIFRIVESQQPTLLIDEADTFLPENEELRGILNSGHRQGGSVIRTVGEDFEPRSFSTYSACAIALIGRLPATLADRSVPIELRRRRADEAIGTFRFDRTGHLDQLACKAARWALDNEDQIRGADPNLPAGVFNRAADNWRPLLAIADAARGEWPERARRAVQCAGASATGDEQSVRVLLLSDIRSIFAERRLDRLSSAELVAALVTIEGRPWAEWKAGKPITPNALARQLAWFKSHRVQSAQARAPLKATSSRNSRMPLRAICPKRNFEPPHRHNPDGTGVSVHRQPPQSNPCCASRRAKNLCRTGIVALWRIGAMSAISASKIPSVAQPPLTPINNRVGLFSR